MIIDYNQRKDGIEVSFVTDDNKIETELIPLKRGYYKYVYAEDFDKDAIPNLRSFKNNSKIKIEPAKYFDKHNINEFFNYDLKHNYADVFEKLNKLSIPNPFSVDIETEITDENGYSTPAKAENSILSLSITDINLNTLIFALKNKDKPEFFESDKIEIQNFITEALGPEHASKYEYNFDIRVFDNETEMLTVFIECVNNYFHSIIGWNFELFDWIWIQNRCERLGIDIRKASPSFKITNKVHTLKDGITKVTVKVPTHRLIGDYMQFFKDSLIYNNLESYSLNYVCELILGLNKVMYDGNLRSLYNDNYNKFIAYAIMDTILVMLVHKTTNLYNVDFFESYYNGIAYSKISQNAISEALIYNELRTDNIFLLHSEFNSAIKRKYRGGFVKKPTKKILKSSAGLDFSGLYPNSINTCGISPDMKIDSINVTDDGKPLTLEDKIIWEKYKKLEYCLAPTGRIYDITKDGVFVRIEKKLIAQRKVFKKHVEDIYLNIIPQLENKLKELKN